MSKVWQKLLETNHTTKLKIYSIYYLLAITIVCFFVNQCINTDSSDCIPRYSNMNLLIHPFRKKKTLSNNWWHRRAQLASRLLSAHTRTFHLCALTASSIAARHNAPFHTIRRTSQYREHTPICVAAPATLHTPYTADASAELHQRIPQLQTQTRARCHPFYSEHNCVRIPPRFPTYSAFIAYLERACKS